MFKHLRSLLYLLSICLLYYGCDIPTETGDSSQEYRDVEDYETQKIQITFQEDSMMVHPTWLEKPVNFSVKLLSSNQRYKVTAPIDSALSKYPKSLLEKYLKKIYVFERIECYGAVYGATNDYQKRHLFISFKDYYNADEVEEQIHHELSHIYFNLFAFEQESKKVKFMADWERASKGRIEKDGHQAILDNSAKQDFDEKLMQKGFISQYAKSNLKEDLAEIIECLFLGKQQLWDYAKQYPLIKKKLNLAIKFLRENIHQDFSKEYFKKLIKNPKKI